MKRPRITNVARVLDTLADGHPPTMLGSFSGRLPAFQILIGTILSARSRDEMTAKVCEALFRKYPTPESLARARPQQLVPVLRLIGFYRQKAKYIVETARLIMEKHGGQVPTTFEPLIQLPGVGRKVANCVLVYAFGKPAIAVDTHVHRIANRLGWVRSRTPEETERALAAFLPRRYWLTINERLVAHGKTVCRPIGPKCDECPVRRWCRQCGVIAGLRRRSAAGAAIRRSGSLTIKAFSSGRAMATFSSGPSPSEVNSPVKRGPAPPGPD